MAMTDERKVFFARTQCNAQVVERWRVSIPVASLPTDPAELHDAVWEAISGGTNLVWGGEAEFLSERAEGEEDRELLDFEDFIEPVTHTPNGYDPDLVRAINGVLDDRETGLHLDDLTDELWFSVVGPMMDRIERVLRGE